MIGRGGGVYTNLSDDARIWEAQERVRLAEYELKLARCKLEKAMLEWGIEKNRRGLDEVS